MRTYVVLLERIYDTDVGDHVFVLLGFYEASTPRSAKRKAWREHAITTAVDLVNTVTVPASSWARG